MYSARNCAGEHPSFLKVEYRRGALVVPALRTRDAGLNRTIALLRLRVVVCRGTYASVVHVHEYRCLFAC